MIKTLLIGIISQVSGVAHGPLVSFWMDFCWLRNIELEVFSVLHK